MAQIRDISKRTALYERLSKDDEQQGESNSILNQKQYLEEYAHKNGFVNIQHFTDDGYTGRNFNRPGFQEMLAEIENGKIGTVIVKDMSRFGRNYLQVGFYTEMMFPQKQVRFIAINNSVDSDKPQDNNFTPFLNIMNEWYAKDTSNKIKSIFLSRMNDGKRCSGSIPYGYNRLPGDKQTLVVDPVASKVVKHIFALAADGYNPPTIAKKLTEEEVLIPSAYTLQYHPEQCNRKSEWRCTRWNPTTVREILERQEYLGHTVLRKTIGTNFKTDARRFSTDEEKLIFKDTHEPIIEEHVWTRVQKELKCHKYSPDRGKYQLTCRLPGLVYCADCGRVMGYNIRHNVNSDCYFYRCSTYSGYQTTQHRACTAHIISDDVLCELVLHSIQRMAKHIIADEKAFAMELRKRWQEQAAGKPQEQKEELSRAKRRLEELDRLIGGLYENYMTGTLPEKQYRSLMKRYSDEQAELDKRTVELTELLQAKTASVNDIERFIKIIKKYKEPTSLTADMARELIDKIVIHETVGRKKDRQQQVDIYYNFIGQFDFAPTEEEIREAKIKAEQELAEKERLRKERAKKSNEAFQKRAMAARWAANDGHKFPKRVCEYCGKEFYPNGSRQKYCGADCLEAHGKAEAEKRRSQKKERRYPQKNCKICGKAFWPSHSQEILCSKECKIINYNRNHLAYYHRKQSEKKAKSKE